MERKITKKIYVGNVPVGGGSPISIQSMTNTITKDVFSTARQINEFVKEGCNISRSAVNDLDDALAIKKIKSLTTIPFIADIQYDYKLAIMGRSGKQNPRLAEDWLRWVDEDSIVKIIENTYKYAKEFISKDAPNGKEHVGYIVDRTGFKVFREWALKDVNLPKETIEREPIYWSGPKYNY